MNRKTKQIVVWATCTVLAIGHGFSQHVDPVTVFQRVNLVPMTRDTVIPNQTVVVRGTLISEIGNSDLMQIPAGAFIIDGSGKYLMPGLADLHAHYLSDYDRNSFFNLFLKNGVTTVRLFQSFPNDSCLVWSEKIKHHELFGPYLFTCGLFFNDPVIPASTIVTAKRNYDFIKLYGGLSRKEFNTTMRMAKKENVYTIGHVPFLVGLDGVIREGMNEVGHITELDFDLVRYPKLKPLRNMMFGLVYNNWFKDFYSYSDEQAYLLKKDKKLDQIVRKVHDGGLWVNSTLVVTRIMNEQLFEKDKFLQRPELPYMIKRFMPEYLAGQNTYQLTVNALLKKNQKIVKGDDGRKFFSAYLAVNRILTRKLHDAGVPVLLGSDCPAITVAVVPGYSIHEELQALTECGLTPFESIQAGTTNAGMVEQAMTGVNHIGTIEVGKQADFILTNGNPLENVSNIKHMEGIMVQGRWLQKSDLDTLQVFVKSSLADAITAIVSNNGNADAIAKKYNDIQRDSSGFYSSLPDPLNDLGYSLIHQGKFDEAIAVFSILNKEFPENWMWLDSLGEAYMKAGRKDEAIENYEKSVQLNPDSSTGKAALKKLRKQCPS